jgi:peptide/nickel transport system substrate-binding protein
LWRFDQRVNSVWAKRLISEAGYKGERIVVLDVAEIPVAHAEALITDELFHRLGLNVELAASDLGTIFKRISMREPVEQGGWSVYNLAPVYFELINPATNRNLRAGGVAGSLPGWPTDE